MSGNRGDRLLETRLSPWHASHGGRMVDFAGWTMPVQYQSVIAEHHQTRQQVGLFDVSHMGRFFFSGPGVGEFLDSLTTRRIDGVDVGSVRYSLLTNDRGTVLDDVLVYKMLAAGPYVGDIDDDNAFYMMVVNASNREKVFDHITAALGRTPMAFEGSQSSAVDESSAVAKSSAIKIEDKTESSAMMAVQGPRGNEIVASIASVDPASLKYYQAVVAKVDGVDAIVSRTGYTGEDGCEIILNGDAAVTVWEKLHRSATAIGGGAAGLAARDTLRLEAAMPLYGHELSESISAAQANLRFAINLKDRQFCGRQSIAAGLNDPNLPVRVGIMLQGKRPAREGCDVLAGGNVVGRLTSGTLSPTLKRPIAMGYVLPSASDVGTKVQIDIRGKLHDAAIVEMPFYKRPS